mgnify:FL=1
MYYPKLLSTQFLFQSTLPSRGETTATQKRYFRHYDFNPLSPHGERPLWTRHSISFALNFNPLSPHGERLAMFKSCSVGLSPFQSTLPSRGETTGHQQLQPYILISIHSPLTGRDSSMSRILAIFTIFQSTLPSRGETQFNQVVPLILKISIHSPLTGRDNIVYFMVSR